jgi:hypothetical protein
MEKLMADGYMFIRRDDHPSPRIKYRKHGSGDWKTLGKFETKAARDREVDRLLDSSMVIMDSY